MDFEWDVDKRISNAQKHGIDFQDSKSIFDDDIVTIEDNRFNYGEQRFLSFGLLQGRVIAVVHTETYDTIRLISVRKATRHEQQFFFEQLTH